MTAANLIHELNKLPLTEKLFIIEHTLKSIKTEKQSALKTAVDKLYEDYNTDKELIIFTALDSEPFYETR